MPDAAALMKAVQPTHVVVYRCDGLRTTYRWRVFAVHGGTEIVAWENKHPYQSPRSVEEAVKHWCQKRHEYRMEPVDADDAVPHVEATYAIYQDGMKVVLTRMGE